MRACAEKCNASCVEVGGARRRRHQSGRRCSGWCSRRCAAHLVRASSGTVEDREEDAPPRSLAIGWLSEPRVEPGHARLPCAMIGRRLVDRRHDCEEDVHTHTQRNMHGESLGNIVIVIESVVIGLGVLGWKRDEVCVVARREGGEGRGRAPFSSTVRGQRREW